MNSNTATARSALADIDILDVADIGWPEASSVLWFFDDPAGVRPGGFTESLLQTIAHADLTNRALLERGFPEWVRAFNAASNEPGGIEALRRVAEMRL